MVQLVHLAGCQADLVAVRRVARGRGGHQLALRQLARQRLAHGNQRVGRARHAHGLVDVAAARQGVADGAAHAGGCAAERLDFGRMVVRLVLEQVQPVLLFAVHVHLALHGAGVDLLGLVEAGQHALRLQPARADGAHVHEAHRLLVAAQLVAHLKVLLERGLHGLVLHCHVVQHGAERGVAAVIGPVRVDHLDFGDGGVAPLFGEVLLAERDVGQVHGQPAVSDERRQARLIQLQEPAHRLHHARHGLLHVQRLAHIKRRLARFDGVDHVVLDGGDVLVGQRALQHVHLRAAHLGALALADQLDAFACRIGALVELAGKVLHGEHRHPVRLGHLQRRDVGLRLAEHGGHALSEQLVRDPLHVVAIHHAEILKRADAQQAAQLLFQLLRLPVEAGLLLHVDTRNHGPHLTSSNPCRKFSPPSARPPASSAGGTRCRTGRAS